MPERPSEIVAPRSVGVEWGRAVGKQSMMPLTEVLERWRPSSHPQPWSWADERLDLVVDSWTIDLLGLIKDEGIREPVLLGPYGRVWEGHHRLCIAYWLGIDEFPVDVVEVQMARDPMSVRCPVCGADVDERCINQKVYVRTQRTVRPHQKRIQVVRKAATKRAS